jgi:hypothetical protein
MATSVSIVGIRTGTWTRDFQSTRQVYLLPWSLRIIYFTSYNAVSWTINIGSYFLYFTIQNFIILCFIKKFRVQKPILMFIHNHGHDIFVRPNVAFRWDCVPVELGLYQPDETRVIMVQRWNYIDKENGKSWRETSPSATLSIINRTWTGMEVNPVIRVEKLVNNSLN